MFWTPKNHMYFFFFKSKFLWDFFNILNVYKNLFENMKSTMSWLQNIDSLKKNKKHGLKFAGISTD